jgi:hypothetical protein
MKRVRLSTGLFLVLLVVVSIAANAAAARSRGRQPTEGKTPPPISRECGDSRVRLAFTTFAANGSD